MSDSIFYAIGKEQHGPASIADLRALVAKGEFRRTDRVWREGMSDWQPAVAISELFAGMPPDLKDICNPRQTPPPLPGSGTDWVSSFGALLRSWDPPRGESSTVKNSRTTASRQTKAAGLQPLNRYMAPQRRLFLTTYPAAFVFMFIGVCLDGRFESTAAAVSGLIGFTFLVVAYVNWMKIHYQMWKLIPRTMATTTPGKAVGFYFIPLFNFYWMFITFGSLAKDANKALRSINEQEVHCDEQLPMSFAGVQVLYFLFQPVPLLQILVMIACYLLWIRFYGNLDKAFVVIDEHTRAGA